MSDELTEIYNDFAAILGRLDAIVAPSPDVAAHRVEPAPPTPKFAPGDNVVHAFEDKRGTGTIIPKEGQAIKSPDCVYSVQWSYGITMTHGDHLRPAPLVPKFAPGQRVRVVRDTESAGRHFVAAGTETKVVKVFTLPLICPIEVELENEYGTHLCLKTADLEAIPGEPAKPEPPSVPRFKIGDPVELSDEAKAGWAKDVQYRDWTGKIMGTPSAMACESYWVEFFRDGKTWSKMIFDGWLIPAKSANDPAHLPERTPVVVNVTECLTLDATLWFFGVLGPKTPHETRRRSVPIGWTFTTTDTGEVVLRHTFGQTMTARDVYEKEDWSVTG